MSWFGGEMAICLRPTNSGEGESQFRSMVAAQRSAAHFASEPLKKHCSAKIWHALGSGHHVRATWSGENPSS